MLTDPFGRRVTYLRLSVTARCDLRCVYCRPRQDEPCAAGASPPCPPLLRSRSSRAAAQEEGGTATAEEPEAPAGGELSLAELTTVARVAAELGVEHVRVTGGEPLLREDVGELVRVVSRLPGIREVSLTTNGQRLAERAAELARAGLRRVNVSLDSLLADRYALITGGGSLARVTAGLEACRSLGIAPIKLNAVLLRGLNVAAEALAYMAVGCRWRTKHASCACDGPRQRATRPTHRGPSHTARHPVPISGSYANASEVPDFARLARDEGFHVRFIELLPLGCAAQRLDLHYPASEALEALLRLREAEGEAAWPLKCLGRPGPGPAEVWQVGRGSVGFVASSGPDFCETCNRLRLTSDGHLRPCLCGEREIDLAAALQSADAGARIAAAFREAAAAKPLRGAQHGGALRTPRGMCCVGG